MAYNTILREFTGTAAIGVTCWCSIQFAIPTTLFDYYKRANERQPGSFELHCPLGHTFIPAGPSDADKLRDQLAREKHWREQAEARAASLREQKDRAERQVAARKGVITRMKRRAVKGMCPCCSRKFKDLATHMREQHPAFDPEKHAAAIEAKED